MLNLLQKYKRQQSPNIIEKNTFSWTKVIVYLWAVRLGFCGIGILIPGFSFLGMVANRNNVMKPAGKTLEIIPWEKFSSNLLTVRYGQNPVEFEKVPALPKINVEYILDAGLKSIIKKGKKSKIPLFQYQDLTTLWAQQYQFASNIEDIYFQNNFQLDILNDSLSNNEENIEGPDDKWYYYISEKIDVSTSHAFLTTLVPSMTTLLEENMKIDHLPPSIMTWISSEGAMAAPHYDMEDNFFVQVAGTKTFVISAPSAYRCFSPYPTFHPAWRQAQWKHLNTSDELNAEMSWWNDGHPWPVLASAGSLGVGFTVPQTEIHSHQNSAKSSNECTNRLDKKDSADSVCNSPNSVITNVADAQPPVNANVWEVTMYPGSILYIPAFYYHSTHADSDSISINLWTKSLANEVKSKLSLVSLPYQRHDSTGVKLASLGAAIRLTVYNLGESLDWFLKDMNSRYVGLIVTPEEERAHLEQQTGNTDSRTDETDPFVVISGKLSCMNQFNASQLGNNLCTSMHHAVGDANPFMRKTAMSLSAYLTADPLDPAIQRLLLMDYIEEVVQVILSPLEIKSLLSPCALSNFVVSCISRGLL